MHSCYTTAVRCGFILDSVVIGIFPNEVAETALGTILGFHRHGVNATVETVGKLIRPHHTQTRHYPLAGHRSHTWSVAQLGPSAPRWRGR